jgi:dTDP-4-amino-4,6-dideoxygalactose transaminase
MLPFAQPDIGVEEINAVTEVLAKGWVTSGPEMKAFEAEMATYLEADVQTIAVNSATSGLLLAMLSLGMNVNDYVIVPSITFAASIETILQAGGQPIICDVDSDQNMSLATLDAAVNRCLGVVRAVMLVHFAGKVPREYSSIRAYCRKKGIEVIEDCAHSFGAIYQNGLSVGAADSYASVFSFYATKNITTGEGGMIVTKDERLAGWFRKMRLHGIDRDVFDRYTSTVSKWEYDVTLVGYKMNMPDTAAAMGRVQLKRNTQMHARRKEITQFYQKELPKSLTLPAFDSTAAYHLYPIQLPNHVKRDQFIERMFDQGIGMSMHFKPLHRLTAYKSHEKLYPMAEQYWQTACSIPLYSKMTDQQAAAVVESVWKCIHV